MPRRHLLTATAGEDSQQVSIAKVASNGERAGTENRSKLNLPVAEDNHCMKAGMDGYVAKPIRADELLASISQVRRAAERNSVALVR